MKAQKKQAKHNRKNRGWKPMRPGVDAGGGWRGGALAAALALLACAAWFLLPSGGSAASGPVVIARVMSANPAVCYNLDGEYYDWLELANTGDADVDLAGWRLTDDVDLRGGYVFEAGAVLPAGGRLMVYCAPRPEDYAGDAIFCGFKLDSDGELLVLADANQRVAQALDVPALRKTYVYQRDAETGAYQAMPFRDTLALDADYAARLSPAFEANGLRINEAMAQNKTTLLDEDDDYSDWLELYNGASQPVRLGGCALSDDDANQRKWLLPDAELAPGEYKIVFLSGKDRRDAAGEWHANFSLSSHGETVRLYDAAGGVLSWAEFGASESDMSYSRLPDGTLTTALLPTPGFENTEAGAEERLTRLTRNARGLYINELMTLGDGCDWVELYNAGAEAADLSGMGLSDDVSRPRKWQFPEGARVAAGGYVVVALVGSEDDGAKAPEAADYRADFAVSEGETVCLSQPDGTLIDRVTVRKQFDNLSLGRAEGYEKYRYFAELTPGSANAAKSYEGQAAGVVFSQAPGAHAESSLTLELTTDPDARVYYTTDGSAPTANSKKYEGPLTLKANTFIRAVAWREGLLPSEETSGSFILNASHGVRLVCVYGDHGDLDGSGGVLNTGVKGAKGVGQGVYAEIYEPDGTRLVSQSCMLRISGHDSRVTYAQKGFTLKALKAYGPGKFKAALFSGRDYTEYNALFLRASGQDCLQTHMRDSILSALAAGTSVLYQETEVCVVYVNGRYWGVYNMREHVDRHSIAQFEGWDDPDDVVMLEGAATVGARGLSKVIAWVRKNSLAKDENVEKLREVVDIENYLDYVALQIYTCNQDLNNVRIYRNPKAEDNRWHWVLYDLDLSYQIDRNNVKDWLSGDEVGTITAQSCVLFRHMMKNAALRDAFLTRAGQLLAGDLSAESVVARIQARYELIKPEMAANCKRWGWSTATWTKYLKRMVTYAKKRPEKLAGYYKEAFHLSDAQARQYFGEALGASAG